MDEIVVESNVGKTKRKLRVVLFGVALEILLLFVVTILKTNTAVGTPVTANPGNGSWQSGHYVTSARPAGSPDISSAGQSALDCISCHDTAITYHDKLGEGNELCWSCHVSTDPDMATLHLSSGNIIDLRDSTQLCGQCHQERYAAWQQGTHGIPGTVAATDCISCHNPHQPQVAFLGITKPPPPPLETTLEPPRDAVMIVGISIGFLLILAIIAKRRREDT